MNYTINFVIFIFIHSGNHVQPHVFFYCFLFRLTFQHVENIQQDSKSSLTIKLFTWALSHAFGNFRFRVLLLQMFGTLWPVKGFLFNVQCSIFIRFCLLGIHQWASCAHFSLGKLRTYAIKCNRFDSIRMEKTMWYLHIHLNLMMINRNKKKSEKRKFVLCTQTNNQNTICMKSIWKIWIVNFDVDVM